MTNATLDRDTLSQWSATPPDRDDYSSYVHNTIRTALHNQPDLDAYDYAIMPAGSRSRGTHIAGSSDTDVLVRLQTDATNPMKRYDIWHDFNKSVRGALAQQFGQRAVEQAAKCIDVTHPDVPGGIDVVSCLAQKVRIGQQTLPAIELWTQGSAQHIISLPREHHRRVQHKNIATGNSFTPLVRAIKFHKDTMIKQKIIGEKTAPSYMVESAALSMPSELFTDDPQENFKRFISFMKYTANDPTALRHGNGLQPLVGNHHTQWGPRDMRRYVANLLTITLSN